MSVAVAMLGAGSAQATRPGRGASSGMGQLGPRR
jgi:hypothetical protein